MTQTTISTRTEAVERIVERIANDLTLITDRSLALHAVDVETAHARPAGEGGVHVSFKLGLARPGEMHHGCLLVPLPEAIGLAGYMMMASDEDVRLWREDDTLSEAMKETMLEIANFVAGAADAALRGLGWIDVKVGSEGCQGVRAGVRPAFPYVEGEELLVGRARMALHEFGEFEALLLVPSSVLAG